MRIIAVSPFKIATRQEILDFLAKLPKALIVLPGHSSNTPSPSQIQKVMLNGSVIFAEGSGRKGKRRAYIIMKHNTRRMPSQIFADSPSAEQIDDLMAALPKRTVPFGKREVTFFICGEINAFKPDGSVKHNRKIKYDILANPAHTIMGRWNHLGRKLNRLSKGSVAIHVANNDLNHHGVNTDVRIYEDGVLMRRRIWTNIAWSECSI